MAEKKKEEKPVLSCEICMKEIGHEEGETFEVDEYVHHFCGLECYSKWRHSGPQAESGKKKD